MSFNNCKWLCAILAIAFVLGVNANNYGQHQQGHRPDEHYPDGHYPGGHYPDGHHPEGYYPPNGLHPIHNERFNSTHHNPNHNSSSMSIHEGARRKDSNEIDMLWSAIKDRLPVELSEAIMELVAIIRQILPQAIIEACEHLLHDLHIIKSAIPVSIRRSIERVMMDICQIWPEIMQHVQIYTRQMPSEHIVKTLIKKFCNILREAIVYLEEHLHLDFFNRIPDNIIRSKIIN